MKTKLEETIDAMTLAFWGRETCQHDNDAVARFGMPKYGCGTKLTLGNRTGPGYAGHQFEVEGMFWSDLMHSWVYYVPAFDFYQCESDLEGII